MSERRRAVDPPLASSVASAAASRNPYTSYNLAVRPVKCHCGELVGEQWPKACTRAKAVGDGAPERLQGWERDGMRWWVVGCWARGLAMGWWRVAQRGQCCW